MLRRPLAPAVVVLGCLLATAVVWVVAFHTAAGARLDSTVLDGFTGLRGSRLEPLAAVAVALADPLPVAAMALAIVTIAAARRRPRHVIVAAVVLVGANVTTELLKPLATVARPAEAPPLAPLVDAWPSGHMTAAMTVALCLVLVVPTRWRPSAAAAGGLFAVAEGYGLLVMGWHYPSDVLGACSAATGWLALGLAAVRAASSYTDPSSPRAQPVVWPAVVGCGPRSSRRWPAPRSRPPPCSCAPPVPLSTFNSTRRSSPRRSCSALPGWGWLPQRRRRSR
jgi:membrane-associated phospholipid phosphatase